MDRAAGTWALHGFVFLELCFSASHWCLGSQVSADIILYLVNPLHGVRHLLLTRRSPSSWREGRPVKRVLPPPTIQSEDSHELSLMTSSRCSGGWGPGGSRWDGACGGVLWLPWSPVDLCGEPDLVPKFLRPLFQ